MRKALARRTGVPFRPFLLMRGRLSRLMPREGATRAPLIAEMAAWKRDYPEAFSRNYDPATGVSLSGWLIEDEVRR